MIKRFFSPVFLSAATVGLTLFLAGCATPPEKSEDDMVVEETPIERPEETSVAEKLAVLRSVDDLDEALSVLEDTESLTSEEQIVMAALQVAEGELDRASQVLDAVLEKEPENPDAIYTYALLNDAEGREDERDARLQEVLSINPRHIDTHLFQGMVWLDKREYENAYADFSLVLDSEPENVLALSGAANALMYMDELEESVELLDKAIALEPEYAYLYVDRARAWKGLKKYGKTEENYTRAIELEPDIEWHYLDRAMIRIQYFNDLEGGWEDLTKLEDINPDNFFGNVYMAGILDDWKRYEEAEKHYKMVLAARPHYGFAHEPLAKIAYMDGRYGEAKDHFLQAFDFDSRDFSYILAAVICMEKMDDRKSAERLLKEVSPKIPRESILYEMFRYYLSPGSDFFITDKIKKEENEDLRSRMYFYLGARYDLNGLRQSALAAYGKVLEKSEFYESDLASWELQRTEE